MKTLRTDAHKYFVEELKTLRKSNGITQVQLAEILGVHQSYVAKVEGLERRLDVIEYVRWIQALTDSSGYTKLNKSIWDHITAPKG